MAKRNTRADYYKRYRKLQNLRKKEVKIPEETLRWTDAQFDLEYGGGSVCSYGADGFKYHGPDGPIYSDGSLGLVNFNRACRASTDEYLEVLGVC